MILKYCLTTDETAVACENEAKSVTYHGMVRGNTMTECVQSLIDYCQGPYEPITDLYLSLPDKLINEHRNIVEEGSSEDDDRNK